MRYLYATLIGILVVAVALFALQNLGHVTVSFLTMGATMPLALLVVLVYLGGMATGFVAALLRAWMKGARKTAL